MVLTDGVTRVLGANAHTTQTYSPTSPSVHAWCNCVDGSGVGIGAMSRDIWELNAYALIMCSFCNVS